MKFYLMLLSLCVFGGMSSVMANEPAETTTEEVAAADEDAAVKADTAKEETSSCSRCKAK